MLIVILKELLLFQIKLTPMIIKLNLLIRRNAIPLIVLFDKLISL